MKYRPSAATRQGAVFHITTLQRCIHNPVAPESAINVFVNDRNYDDGDSEKLVFLGHVGKEIAERIGPLHTQGIIRVGISTVHWDTFNADFKGEWYIDIVIFVPSTGLAATQREQVVAAVQGLPVTTFPAVYDV